MHGAGVDGWVDIRVAMMGVIFVFLRASHPNFSSRRVSSNFLVYPLSRTALPKDGASGLGTIFVAPVHNGVRRAHCEPPDYIGR